MTTRLAAVALTAAVSFSSAALAQDATHPTMCDPIYERGPSFVLPEGYVIYVDPNQPSACVGGRCFENYPEIKGDEIEMCRVGPGTLDVGPGPFGQYYDDPETGRKADERVMICRDNEGHCVLCADLTS